MVRMLLTSVGRGIGTYGVVFILRYYGGFWYVAEFGVGVGAFNWRVGGVVGHARPALVVHPFSLGTFLQHPLSCCIVLCFLGLLFEDYHQLLHCLSCHVGWRYDSCN